MVARIKGTFESTGTYGRGIIHDSELLPDAPNGDIKVTSGWLAWEPWRKEMKLFGHLGADLNYPGDLGGRIVCPTRGKILVNRWSGAGGNILEIDIGVAGGVREVIGLFHLWERSPHEEGDLIKPGDVLGRIGTTGWASTGPHLHFTRRTGPPDSFGNLADPIELFDPNPVDGVLDDVLPTLNEMYLMITDSYYGGYNPDYKTLLKIVAHPEGWDQQVIISRRHQ